MSESHLQPPAEEEAPARDLLSGPFFAVWDLSAGLMRAGSSKADSKVAVRAQDPHVGGKTGPDYLIRQISIRAWAERALPIMIQM